MNKKINTIAVLITCHNRKEKTLKCLESLYNQIVNDCNFVFNVFLVDDGSSDHTADAVRENYPDVRVIEGNGDLFWNRGMYLAWDTASKEFNPDFYLWLNDDTNLYPNAIKQLLEAPHQNSIISGTTEDILLNRLSYGGYNKNHQLIKPNNNYQPCEYFNGNIVLISNYVFNQIGNLDYRFRHALGDFDYGLRAKARGIKLFISKEIIGSCELHKEFPDWCNKKNNLITRIKKFRTPLGLNPIEYYHFDKRHYGIRNAIFHFFTIHIRLLFPQLWSK
jgi:GT2 family glycosyltransferase